MNDLPQDEAATPPGSAAFAADVPVGTAPIDDTARSISPDR